MKSNNVFMLASGSVFQFFTLILSGSLHLPLVHVGKLYRINHSENYKAFRETTSDKTTNDTQVILIVGFRLKVIGSNAIAHWIFQRICILTTPFWSGFQGFRIKLWMVSPETKNYLGIYEWEGKEHAQIYVNALIQILTPLSIRDSVWHTIIEHQEFEKYLRTREV